MIAINEFASLKMPKAEAISYNPVLKLQMLDHQTTRSEWLNLEIWYQDDYAFNCHRMNTFE